VSSLQHDAHKCLREGYYEQAIQLYEKVTQAEPENISHCWYLGLAYLLQQQEELAQTTWLFALALGTHEEVEAWTQELVEILEIEAQQQTINGNLENSWLVRQHIHNIQPDNVNNLLYLTCLSIDLESFSLDLLDEWQVEPLVSSVESDSINEDLLLKTLLKILNFPSLEVINLLESSLLHATSIEKWVDTLTTSALKITDQMGQPDIAVQIIELCLRLSPTNSRSLQYLCSSYEKAGKFQESYEAAIRFSKQCVSVTEKMLGNYLVAEAFIKACGWLNADELVKSYKSSMQSFINENTNNTHDDINFSLILVPSLLTYLQDNPKENNHYQGKIASIFQEKLKPFNPSFQFLNSLKKKRPLRIGYIAHTLRVHSVGWLSRWLFQYHDKEDFDIGVYFVNQNSDNNFSKTWFKDKVSFHRTLGINPQEIVDQIKKDDIDILVDLDSTTFNVTCIVMAFKPAPIQVTWLGKDASEISTIDYFMADPYVLPEDAQNYYQEKIWRLPQTYIAVDGFEADVPSLRREHLNIPSGAIVYLTAQNGMKRHPDTIRLQLKILKEVKKSFLLVKGRSNETATQQLFVELSEEEGIDPHRLRFLPVDSNEFIHRANLQIADVVLDTYPYNGATTTLETLWAGVPLVTRVGQQFAARNSYAFLMNVGVTEGIAWTDEEYVEWGVRFGQDEELRQKVAWKLQQSRKTSPLWNAKQFTREMEDAYRKMWAIYATT
jgi:predicted O-linked N-acetylglucosamine transferase (SPINDLY family)